jgi:drug/metabolite transporter (DMT)-like permease
MFIISFISKLLYKIKNPKIRHAIWVVSAFVGVALLFNNNSYHADKTNTNGVYLWVGIILCAFAIITAIAALMENKE